MLLIGLGSTGARAVAHAVKWAQRLSVASDSTTLAIGLDTNEAEVQSLQGWIGSVLPPGWSVEFHSIGKALPTDGNGDGNACFGGLDGATLKQLAGGVVATHTGAGNRRLLGLWSYCAPPPPGNPDVWNRDSVFGPTGPIAAAGAPLNIAVVVGSLLGGTASGAFPRVGADVNAVAPPAGPIATRVALALLPRPNHASAVRKANALAALRDLKLQQRAGIWTHVLLVSPGFQADGGGNWLVNGNEQDSLSGLLQMIGLYLLALTLEGSLNLDNGAGLPNGVYILGLRGHYAPVNEVKEAAALQQMATLVKEGTSSFFAAVREQESAGPFLAALEDPTENLNLVVGGGEGVTSAFLRNLEHSPPASPGLPAKQRRALQVIRVAWEDWYNTVGVQMPTPAGLFTRVNSLVEDAWYARVVKSSKEKEVWSESPGFYLFEAYRAFRNPVVRAVQKILGQRPHLDPMIEDLIRRYAVHEFAPQLEGELWNIRTRYLPQIERFLKNNLTAENNSPRVLPDFANPMAGLVLVPIPLPGGAADGILKDRFLELLDKAFPQPGDGGSLAYDPLIGEDQAAALRAFEAWKARAVQSIASALAVAAPPLPPLGGGNPLPLVETVTPPGAPVTKGWPGNGGALWNLQVAYYVTTLQNLQLFQDDESQDELRSLSTFNATRYLPPTLVAGPGAIVPLDPSDPLGTWWQNVATWVPAGGRLTFAGVPPAVAPLIDLANPVPCPGAGDGALCFRVHGLPGVYLRQSVPAGSPPQDYVVVDGVLPGLVWVWGIQHLIDTLPDGDGWIVTVRDYFI